MLAEERSPSTPIGANRTIPEYPPITGEELERLKGRMEELVRKAADRLS
jgi:hypothetical protein